MILRSFQFRYSEGQTYLTFPGFEVPTGNFVLMTGENGSGKTTFLNHLRENPNLIHLDGQGVSCFYLEQFFDNLIFPYKPVWWNVSLPTIISEKICDKEAIEIAAKQLDTFELDIDLNKYPALLSGGEKHLILVARFAVGRHNVLLLDEPTTTVDKKREVIFWNMLYQLINKQKKNIIIASHCLPINADVQNKKKFNGILERKLIIQNYLPQQNKEKC